MKNILNSYLHQSLTNFFHSLMALLGWGPPAKQQFTRKVTKGKLFAQTLVPFGLLLSKQSYVENLSWSFIGSKDTSSENAVGNTF